MKRMVAFLLTGAMACAVCSCSSGNDLVQTSTELNILMQEEYMSDAVITAFEEENGCTVNLTYVNDVEERVEKLKGSSGEYDLVLVNDGYVAQLADEELLSKFSYNELSNTSNLNEAFWSYKSYCIPYLMKYVYLVVDTKTCPVEIRKYKDLMAPEMKGQFALPETEWELVMMALATQGYAPNSIEDEEIKDAYEWLVKLDENEPIYGNAKQALLDGTVTAAVIDDREAAEVMAKNKDLKIASLTKDKIRVEIDTFVIPKKAAHKDLAEMFLNYICDPAVTAKNLEEYPYSTPNEAALELVSKEYLKKKERQFDYPERVYFRKNPSEAKETYEMYYEKLKELK